MKSRLRHGIFRAPPRKIRLRDEEQKENFEKRREKTTEKSRVKQWTAERSENQVNNAPLLTILFFLISLVLNAYYYVLYTN